MVLISISAAADGVIHARAISLPGAFPTYLRANLALIWQTDLLTKLFVCCKHRIPSPIFSISVTTPFILQFKHRRI